MTQEKTLERSEKDGELRKLVDVIVTLNAMSSSQMFNFSTIGENIKQWLDDSVDVDTPQIFRELHFMNEELTWRYSHTACIYTVGVLTREWGCEDWWR